VDNVVESVSFLDRHLVVDEIDGAVGDAIENLIRFWNKVDEENNTPIEERVPIKIYIDSPGGDLNATFTMIDAIRLSKTPVWTINVGMAYSGGFFTFIAGHKRFAYPHSSFLYHEGSAGNSGTSNQFQNFAAFYKSQLNQLKDIVLKYTKVTPELYEEKRRDDWWISADEAIELGIADEIMDKFI
jgi:ATP-dependent Clp protease protease subunit